MWICKQRSACKGAQKSIFWVMRMSLILILSFWFLYLVQWSYNMATSFEKKKKIFHPILPGILNNMYFPCLPVPISWTCMHPMCTYIPTFPKHLRLDFLEVNGFVSIFSTKHTVINMINSQCSPSQIQLLTSLRILAMDGNYGFLFYQWTLTGNLKYFVLNTIISRFLIEIASHFPW